MYKYIIEVSKPVGNPPEDRISIKLLYANVVNNPSEDITIPFVPKLPDIPQDFGMNFQTSQLNWPEPTACKIH